jgi:hypothetical protein
VNTTGEKEPIITRKSLEEEREREKEGEVATLSQ